MSIIRGLKRREKIKHVRVVRKYIRKCVVYVRISEWVINTIQWNLWNVSKQCAPVFVLRNFRMFLLRAILRNFLMFPFRLFTASEFSAKRRHSGHFRPATAEVWDSRPQYEFTAFGRRFRLLLAHDTSFVSPNIKVKKSVRPFFSYDALV